MPHLSPVDYAIPGFLLLIVIEMFWAARRAPEKYEPKDTLTSLGLGIGSTVAGALTAGLVLAMALWLYQHRLLTIGEGTSEILSVVIGRHVLGGFVGN